MTRTDIHRPSAIDPQAYDFVCFGFQRIEGFGDCHEILENRRILEAFIARTGATWAQHEHGGSCHICGAAAVYTVIFWHRATNELIRTGGDCATKLEMSYGDLNRFRAAVNDAREAHAGKRKAAATLADAGLAHLWDIYTADGASLPVDERGRLFQQEVTVRDIVGKLVRYGSVTDRSFNYLHILSRQIAERPIRLAERAAKEAATPAIVAGRYEITGVVVKGEWRESHFGTSYKITVKDAEGRAYWGTCPASLLREREPKHGDRVTFVATIETTDKKTFGFFKRPTGGVFTDEVNREHAAEVASVIAPDVTYSPSVATGMSQPVKDAPTSITVDALLAGVKR